MAPEDFLMQLYHHPSITPREFRLGMNHSEQALIWDYCNELYHRRWFDYPDGKGILDGQLTPTGRLAAASSIGKSK